MQNSAAPSFSTSNFPPRFVRMAVLSQPKLLLARSERISMTQIDEIAPDVFRLSLYVPTIDMQFNHFLVRDDEPLLFHAGLKGMFPALEQAIATLIDPARLRYIAWSHFESDECGSLNDWLAIAPNAEPVCTFVGKIVT